MIVVRFGDHETLCRQYRAEQKRRLIRRRLAGMCMLEISLLLLVTVSFLVSRCGAATVSGFTAVCAIIKACGPCTVILLLSGMVVCLVSKLQR